VLSRAPRTAGRPRCVATAVRFYQLPGNVKTDITEGGVPFEGSLESEDFKGAAVFWKWRWRWEVSSLRSRDGGNSGGVDNPWSLSFL